jgi:hypothetical protein
MQVRSADTVEIDHLARLWYDGWHQLHAPLVPPELIRLRTLESFRERLQTALSDLRVAGPPSELVSSFQKSYGPTVKTVKAVKFSSRIFKRRPATRVFGLLEGVPRPINCLSRR